MTDHDLSAVAFAKSHTRDPRGIRYKLTLLEQITLKAETDRPSRVVVARRQLVTSVTKWRASNSQLRAKRSYER
jgi:hypothetical protein